MSKISTKQIASLFATVFWSAYTLSRIISTFIDLKVSTKLKRLSELGVIATVICVVLSLINKKVAATLTCAILEGIAISGPFPLGLAISFEFNLYIS